MTLGDVVARRLREFRNDRNLTQEELAARAGLNRNYVGMIERQENSPTVVTLEKLAEVLGIPPKLFFEEIAGATGGKLPRSRQSGAKLGRTKRNVEL